MEIEKLTKDQRKMLDVFAGNPESPEDFRLALSKALRIIDDSEILIAFQEKEIEWLRSTVMGSPATLIGRSDLTGN